MSTTVQENSLLPLEYHTWKSHQHTPFVMKVRHRCAPQIPKNIKISKKQLRSTQKPNRTNCSISQAGLAISECVKIHYLKKLSTYSPTRKIRVIKQSSHNIDTNMLRKPEERAVNLTKEHSAKRNGIIGEITNKFRLCTMNLKIYLQITFMNKITAKT